MQIVFFDVDGVLVHGYHARPELRKCWDEKIKEDFGIDRERFKNEFILGPFLKEVIIGKKDLKEALSEILPDLGYKQDPQDFIDYWLQNDSNINHDLLEKIRILKDSKKVRLFIATNQEHNRAKHLMHTLGFDQYFEDIFYSARIGVLKPSHDFFKYISDILKLSPDQKPIFFDDTPNVITAAKEFGWDAVEFLNVSNLNQNDFIRKTLLIT